MAFSMNGSGNGNAGVGLQRGRRRYRPLAEINVTPLVDVMLVLLIVFMVTAPLLTSGVNVDLPKTDAAPLNQDATPLTVSINAQGEIYLQDQAVELDELVVKLKAQSQDQPDRRIFVRGDKGITYGRIMEVMGTITQGGFTKVALLAEAPSGAAPAPPSATAPLAPAAAGPARAQPQGAAPPATGAPRRAGR